MDALLRRRAMIAAGGGSPTPPTPSYRRLPDGYTELAYIATDSNAWVDTGIAGAADLSVTVRFSVGTYTQYGAIYGNYLDASHKNNRVMLNSTTQLSVSGGANQGGPVDGFSLNRIHTLIVKSDQAVLENGTTSISAGSQTANNANICLGNRSTTQYVSRDLGLRIYSFSVEKSGSLVLNYVPAKRDVDSKVGFYDLSSDTFVYSQTGTEFVAGPVAEYSGGLLKCLDWNGEDAAVSSKWYDSIGNQYYTISNGTHGTDYHQFINATPSSASQYATLFGALPDLGYHWKIVVDIAVRTQSSNPTTFCPLDFGGLGASDSGTCATGITIGRDTGYWGIMSKFDGNTSGNTYGISGDYNISAETITTTETWIRRKVTFGVRASSVDGKDETFLEVENKGYARSQTPYPPVRFNRWMSPMYIARSLVNPSANYKYATSTRVYSIKVYYEPELMPVSSGYFSGRNISIIGDSISTYNATGYKYDSYSMYYPTGDVNSVDRTYWKMLMDSEGATLEVNLSYSGSSVIARSGYPSLCDRVSLIGDCDTVLIELGTNDETVSAPLGDYSYDKTVDQLDETYFREAYIKAIKQIQAIDADIDIVCVILSMGDDYRNSIKEIATHYALTIVDCGNAYSKGSGVHPNFMGMNEIYRNFLFV